jgi:hypothetical protein
MLEFSRETSVKENTLEIKALLGRAIAQAVSRRLLTATTRVLAQQKCCIAQSAEL